MVVKVTDDDVIDFIHSYWRQWKYGPSVRDIAQQFDTSTSTIYQHLMSLVQDGSLEMTQGRARTWRVAESTST
jgi:SOS-response transcriptional repressor LexA